MSFSEWKKYKLGEVCTKIGSGATPRGGQESYSVEGKYALIRSQNVLDFSFSYNGLAFINEAQANKLSNVALEKDDVLLNITGDSVARVCQVPNSLLPARVNQHVAIIRPQKEMLDNFFLKYYLLNPTFKKFLLNISAVGATRNAITKGMIEGLSINLPDLKTQYRITSILSSLDDAIELNQQINKTLNEIPKAIFKEWFVDFNFPNAIGKFQETEIGKIPVGWKVGKLSDVCEVNKNTLNKKNDLLKWIDYVEISEVSRGQIGNVTRYNLGDEPSRAKRKLKHGDTVLSTVRPDRGSYFLAITPKETDIASTGFAVFSPSKVPFSFLNLFLTDEINLRYYGQVANGGAYPAINPNTIMKMDLIIPDAETLKAFHKIVEPMFLQVQQNIEENQSLSKLRDTLLPKLMKGEIEIKA